MGADRFAGPVAGVGGPERDRPAAAGPTAARPRILLYAMYDPSSQDSAPKVRIRLIHEALARRAEVQVVAGTRRSRIGAAIGWLRRAGMGSVDMVYVESATSAPTPFDLAFLTWARLRRRPVGIYFRDAYQLFRDLYPLTRRRQHLADLLWRLALPVQRALATVAFTPTAGLAEVLGLSSYVLLPPGIDHRQPYLGAGRERLVAAVTTLEPAAELTLLVEAVERVRASRPDVTLLVIGGHGERPPNLPEWVHVSAARRGGIPDLLAPARVCVLPRPITRYTDLALPVKLSDYLALGKPVVATACRATASAFGGTGAVLLAPDTAADLADPIGLLLDDPQRATSMGEQARRLAESDAWSWDARASTLIGALAAAAAARSVPDA